MTTTKTATNKRVRFAEENQVAPHPQQQQQQQQQQQHHNQQRHEEQPDTRTGCRLWYSREEQRHQWQASKASLPAWHQAGNDVLLKQSYRRPHSRVQEYLQAYCCAFPDQRGLEWAYSESDHACERHRVKHDHCRAVLEAAAAQHQQLRTATLTEWEYVAQISRQLSAPSKLFAMRMGRADARAAAATTTSASVCNAERIVKDHLKRQQQQQQRRHASIELQKQPEGRSVRKDSKNNNNLAIALPYRHADAISTLLSLICLQSSAPENNTKSSNDNNKNSIMSAATVDTTTRYYYYQPIITKQPFQHGMVVLPLQQVAMSRMPGLMETGIVIGRLAYC